MMQRVMDFYGVSGPSRREPTWKQVQFLDDRQQSWHDSGIRQGALGEDVPCQRRCPETLADQPVKNETVEQRRSVRNTINRAVFKAQDRDYMTAGKRGQDSANKRPSISATSDFAISDLRLRRYPAVLLGYILVHQELRIPPEVPEVVVIPFRPKSGSANPPSRTGYDGLDHDPLVQGQRNVLGAVLSDQAFVSRERITPEGILGSPS